MINYCRFTVLAPNFSLAILLNNVIKMMGNVKNYYVSNVTQLTN